MRQRGPKCMRAACWHALALSARSWRPPEAPAPPSPHTKQLRRAALMPPAEPPMRRSMCLDGRQLPHAGRVGQDAAGGGLGCPTRTCWATLSDLRSRRHDRSAPEVSEDGEWVEWTCAASKMVSGGGEWCAGSAVVPDVFQTAIERQTSNMRSVEGSERAAAHAGIARGGGEEGGTAGQWGGRAPLEHVGPSSHGPVCIGRQKIEEDRLDRRPCGPSRSGTSRDLEATCGRRMEIAREVSFCVHYCFGFGVMDHRGGSRRMCACDIGRCMAVRSLRCTLLPPFGSGGHARKSTR